HSGEAAEPIVRGPAALGEAHRETMWSVKECYGVFPCSPSWLLSSACYGAGQRGASGNSNESDTRHCSSVAQAVPAKSPQAFIVVRGMVVTGQDGEWCRFRSPCLVTAFKVR
ncbi:hypothetical protein HPB47_000372, partial [Ixodes persulcatus]